MFNMFLFFLLQKTMKFSTFLAAVVNQGNNEFVSP